MSKLSVFKLNFYNETQNPLIQADEHGNDEYKTQKELSMK